MRRNPTDSPSAWTGGTPCAARLATAMSQYTIVSTVEAANAMVYVRMKPWLPQSIWVVEPTSSSVRYFRKDATASRIASAM